MTNIDPSEHQKTSDEVAGVPAYDARQNRTTKPMASIESLRTELAIRSLPLLIVCGMVYVSLGLPVEGVLAVCRFVLFACMLLLAVVVSRKTV